VSLNLKNKRSAVAGSTPTPAQLEDGEIGVNYNSTDPALYIKDSTGTVVRIAGDGAVGTTPADATTTSKGVVQLADAAAVTAGTAGRVVDAAQLKVVSDSIAAEDLWDRSGTELTPKNAGDDVFTSGSVKVGNTTAAPKITVDDGSGRLLVGTSTSPSAASGSESLLIVQGKSTSSGAGGHVSIQKGEPATSITSNEEIGTVNFGDSEGNTFAYVRCRADADAGASVFPSRLEFSTTADGASSPTERLRIDSKGDVKLGGTLPASPNISLNASGSGSFAGPVESTGGDTTNNSLIQLGTGTSNKAGIKLFTDKTLPGVTGITAQINAADGSASFAGAGFKINATGSAKNATVRQEYGSGAGTNVYEFWNPVRSNALPRISFDADGGSAFTGDMKIGGTLPASPNIELKADGSAEFAKGNIVLGSLSSGGYISANRTIGNTAAFQASLNGTATAIIRAEGSAYFPSTVGVGTNQSTPEIALNPDGSATFAGTVTATVVPPSDQKFKENITPASPQLADVVALGNQLKNFDWNADAPVNDEIRAQRQLGLIAQEAEKVCPSLVKTIKRTKQGKELTPETTDADGNVTPATYEELDDSYKGISHDALIMKLLGAVAELQAEVAALKGA
jgi:hypothetical protein